MRFTPSICHGNCRKPTTRPRRGERGPKGVRKGVTEVMSLGPMGLLVYMGVGVLMWLGLVAVVSKPGAFAYS